MHPSAWAEAFSEDVKYLIRGRDPAFTAEFSGLKEERGAMVKLGRPETLRRAARTATAMNEKVETYVSLKCRARICEERSR
jgi:hypothetical protein